MAQHTHDVYDTGKCFEINGLSRFIKETSSTKLVLVQGDHKSEVVTFQMPRYIDGHDMLLCNKIRVHYINIETGTNNKSADIYEVTDLTLCEECEDILTFTWTVEAPATRFAGSLAFLIKFECTEGDSILYQWNTAKYIGVNVLAGIDNSEDFTDKYSNVLQEWYNEITRGADSIDEMIEIAVNDGCARIESEAEKVIERIPEDYTELSVQMGELSQDVDDAQKQIDAERERIDQFTALQDGSTTGDAELMDARVDYTGKAWSNAGDHVRSMTRKLAQGINSFSGTVEVTTEEPTREKTVMVINPESEDVQLYTAEEVNKMIYRPNMLINGDFQVWQRGIAFDLSKNNVYTADRWCITGFSPSATNTVNVAKANNGIQITIDDGNVYRLTQYLEAPLKEDETYTISAKIDGVVYSHSFKGGDDSSSTDKFICGVVDGKPFVQIFIIGETVIEWVKLEQCPVATPFVPRLYTEELLACQRYYYVLPYSQYIVGFASDKKRCYLHSEWAVNNMRNDKTIINKTGNITICHSGANQHAVNVVAMTWEYGSINIMVESDICTHQAAYMYYNSATGYIAIDSEIY